MSAIADPRLVRAWSEEVAREPRSILVFALARAYHDLGRSDAALRLCLRGLEHHPENAEAHFLLGTLYHARGEHEVAFDEWDIALRLDPDHAPARREIGLLYLERGERGAARRHLERAAALAPDDPAVGEALARLGVGRGGGGGSSVAETEAARDARLQGVVDALRAPIDRFAASVRPESVLLISSFGKLLGQHGLSAAYDVVSVASLAAGIHAASGAIARMLDQRRFEHLYQRGPAGQLFIGSVATPSDELILIVVTRDESRLGLLRVGFAAFAREVAALREWTLPQRVRSAETFEHDLESGLRLLRPIPDA